MLDRGPLVENRAAGVLAQSIVDTVREPLLLLDQDLCVLAASRSFYQTFKFARTDVQGKLFYALGDGQWDIPKLRLLLEKILPEQGVMEDYEVEHQFPHIGMRTMLLNARMVFREDNSPTALLLGIEDVTERLGLERERAELMREKDALLREKVTLLEELQHRVANSLQIIAAIIQLKSRTVDSEETRTHLQDAHDRVMSVAAVQQHLHFSGAATSIEIASYLSKLCKSLTSSMISDSRPIVLKLICKGGSVTSREAASLGLVVTELVLNAIKHAFRDDKADRQVTVEYDLSGANWRLAVVDNGCGKPTGDLAPAQAGLGTGILKALAQQLDAEVEVVSGPKGTTVSVTHTASVKAPQAVWRADGATLSSDAHA
jgi:two-component sensor histidine kinase